MPLVRHKIYGGGSIESCRRQNSKLTGVQLDVRLKRLLCFLGRGQVLPGVDRGHQAVKPAYALSTNAIQLSLKGEDVLLTVVI